MDSTRLRLFGGRRDAVMCGATAGLVALVALAITGRPNELFAAILLMASISAWLIRWLFPNGRFLSLTLVNLITVYATIFMFFVDELFGRIRPNAAGVGFSLPVITFLLGCWMWRSQVSTLLDEQRIRDSQSLLRTFSWLIPVFAVGVLAFLFSTFAEGMVNNEGSFLVAMMAIALIVLAASRTIATFLVDAGLLFEEFFRRMSRLVVPAFAFLTFYALLVIIFASLYTLIAQFAAQPPFRVGTEARALAFSEAVHFSVVTLSTVGYGDIVPASNIARALASVEVICGVLLLLFGVSELQEYAREHRHDRNREGSSHGRSTPL